MGKRSAIRMEKKQHRLTEQKAIVATRPERISTEWYYLLRIIAVLTMVTDHLGKVLYSTGVISDNAELWCLIAGRFAFPIFAFLFVESFYHTQNPMRHLIRLIVLALVSEIPFDLALTLQNPTEISMDIFKGQNTIFTFFLCFLMLTITDNLQSNQKCWSKFFGTGKVRKLAVNCGTGIVFGVIFALAYYFKVDYSWRGILLVGLFNFARNRKHCKWLWQIVAMGIFILSMGSNITVYLATFLLLILFFFAQCSEKHKCLILPKWLTKILKSKACIVTCRYFYPAHLAVLAIAKILLTVC